jgi:hypothetical protein
MPTNSSMATITPLPIGNLFGLTLGEALPRGCKVLMKGRMENDKLADWILLPSTNEASNKICWVTFDSSDHRLASIAGGNSTNESGEIMDALLKSMRKVYGKESDYMLQTNGYQFFEWRQGVRNLQLWLGNTGHFSIECSDDQSVNH